MIYLSDCWPGKLILGIVDIEDAIAASLGVDAIVVSIHGVQLDGAPVVLVYHFYC